MRFLIALLALLPSLASAQGQLPSPDMSHAKVTATGGTAARTLADRARDFGMSVLDKGAACDGTTDDTANITAALTSGARRVTIPDARTCYSATGIVIPAGVTLAGTSFAPSDPPVGSTLLCAANVARCLTAGNGVGTNLSGRVESLIVATNATVAPTAGTCLFVDRAYNITLEKVMVYNCFDGYHWYSNLSTGLGGMMRETYSGKVSGAHIIQDGWPELRIESSRFGMLGTGDLVGVTYVRITGGDPSNPTGTGPNGLYVTNTQFNVAGTGSVAHFLQFLNCGGTCNGGASPINASEFYFSQIHVENLTADAITSDATWNVIAQLNISQSKFQVGGHPFWALNAGTTVQNLQFLGNMIAQSSDFTLAPTAVITDTLIAGNGITGNVVLTSNNAASTLSFLGNSVIGNVTLAGPWAGLAVLGGDIRGGSLINGTTGTVQVAVPGVTAFQVVNGTTFNLNGGGAYATRNTGAGTDKNNWDNFASGSTLTYRAVNDALSAATIWLSIDRIGYVPSVINLTSSASINLNTPLVTASGAIASGSYALNGGGTNAIRNTGQGTDQNNWDSFAAGTVLTYRAVNDALSAATNWLTVTRSGYVPFAIGLTSSSAVNLNTATVTASGVVNAVGGYKANGIVGVNCTGVPTSSAVWTLGIRTTC